MILVLRCRLMQGEADRIEALHAATNHMRPLAAVLYAVMIECDPKPIVFNRCRPNTNGSQFFLCTVGSAAA